MRWFYDYCLLPSSLYWQIRAHRFGVLLHAVEIETFFLQATNLHSDPYWQVRYFLKT